MAEKQLEELLHRRDVELPLVEKELQEEMEKIKRSLENVERERKALDIQIDTAWSLNFAGASTSKTILNVPQVQWGYIRSEFLGQEHNLHNACLASAELESLITKNSPATKLKILGEKVFSVLVKNYYLNGGDLMSCLKSDSKDVETFAGMSWWLYLQSRFNDDAKVELQEVKLMSLKCIQNFRDKANQERNRWILFRNKHFIFESRRIGTKAEYEIFWKAALALLKEFGGFIISLQIKDNSAFANTDKGNSGDFDVDLSLIRRTKFLETGQIVLSTHLNRRTFEPFFRIFADYNKLDNSSMFKSVRHSIARVSIDSKTPGVKKVHRQKFVKLAKELDITGTGFNIADNIRLSKAETVVFRGFSLNPRWFISFLQYLRHVKEVILHIDWPPHCKGIQAEAQEKRFPTVRNLTWNLTRKFPGSMDALPKFFPNLRRLKLKCVNLPDFATFRELMAFWNVADIFDEYAIDAFHLYTENMSLWESNIWKYFPGLKFLCVQSVNVLQPQPLEVFGVPGDGAHAQPQMHFGRHEIYTRMENGSIRFENVISPID